MIPLTVEDRARIRREARHPEAQDSWRTYRWSEHGIRVHDREGRWEAFYTLRHHLYVDDPPTRLILTGLAWGDPPAEIAVHFLVLCDICRNITDDHLNETKYNLDCLSTPPRDITVAEEWARWLAS